jgi:hypothetical protein
MARITHTQVTELHRLLALWHKEINGFYRFDIAELANNLRGGINAPVLMLESYSSQYKTNPNKTSNFKDRDISFLLLDYAGNADSYDKHDEVLSRMEAIGDDIASMLDRLGKDKSHWLYMLFDAGTFKMEKIGPIMGNMYGWNILYTLGSKSPLCFEPEKWDIPAA